MWGAGVRDALVPGLVPRDRTDDSSLLTMAAVEEAVGVR
jgi:hypothetical protein